MSALEIAIQVLTGVNLLVTTYAVIAATVRRRERGGSGVPADEPER